MCQATCITTMYEPLGLGQTTSPPTRQRGRCNLRRSPVVSIALVSTGIPASAFLLPTVTFHTTPSKQVQLAPKHTLCSAKLNKIASSFDMDEILMNEKEFDVDGDALPATQNRRRQKGKKQIMKDQLKRKRVEMQKSKQTQKIKKPANVGEIDSSNEFDDDFDGDDVDLKNMIQNINYLAYEVPTTLNGKRVDAVLAELLNQDTNSVTQATNTQSISRSQCGTLLSNECIFLVPPEKTTEFQGDWKAYSNGVNADEVYTFVPQDLIEQHSTPIQRKSHALESSSVIIYPSRVSLFSTSSSSLLSNIIPPTEIIAQKIPLDILYEDEHMIVINKEAGMVVHPAAGNWDGTVVNALAHYLAKDSTFGAGEFFSNEKHEEKNIDASAGTDFNQNDAVTNSIFTLRPGIVHRLDKGTTGVLVVAKTSSALSALSEAFALRQVKKQYLAVTIGDPGEDQWINKPIARHPIHRQKMRVVPDPSSSMSTRGQARLTAVKSRSIVKQGKSALSHIQTIHCDGKLSIVQVRIATGRTHQIRVHLQDHGTPIYGDDVYGLSDWNKALSAKKGISRPLLHAQRLEINHPATGKKMVFEAEPASDMMGVLGAIWPAGYR